MAMVTHSWWSSLMTFSPWGLHNNFEKKNIVSIVFIDTLCILMSILYFYGKMDILLVKGREIIK